jgi:hypothetical protein
VSTHEVSSSWQERFWENSVPHPKTETRHIKVVASGLSRDFLTKILYTILLLFINTFHTAGLGTLLYCYYNTWSVSTLLYCYYNTWSVGTLLYCYYDTWSVGTLLYCYYDTWSVAMHSQMTRVHKFVQTVIKYFFDIKNFSSFIFQIPNKTRTRSTAKSFRLQIRFCCYRNNWSEGFRLNLKCVANEAPRFKQTSSRFDCFNLQFFTYRSGKLNCLWPATPTEQPPFCFQQSRCASLYGTPSKWTPSAQTWPTYCRTSWLPGLSQSHTLKRQWQVRALKNVRTGNASKRCWTDLTVDYATSNSFWSLEPATALSSSTCLTVFTVTTLSSACGRWTALWVCASCHSDSTLSVR